MDTRKFLIGTLVGTVVSFVLSFLIYGMLLSDYMQTNMLQGFVKDPPDFLWMVLGSIFFSALVAFIFLQWASISTFAGGARAGLILGILISLGWMSYMYGGSHLYSGLETMLMDVVASTVIWVIASGAVGATLGALKGKEV
jgi:hypothetical protein